jgi:hypothetical protein
LDGFRFDQMLTHLSLDTRVYQEACFQRASLCNASN